MNLPPQPLPMNPREIAAFCRQHRIQRLWLFGSALEERFNDQSDIDLLVEFDPHANPSLFDIGGMMADLTDRLGRQVDIRTPDDLSPYFRDRVLAQAVPLYESSAFHDSGRSNSTSAHP